MQRALGQKSGESTRNSGKKKKKHFSLSLGGLIFKMFTFNFSVLGI